MPTKRRIIRPLLLLATALGLPAGYAIFWGTCGYAGQTLGVGYDPIEVTFDRFFAAAYLMVVLAPLCAVSYGIAAIVNHRRRPTLPDGNCPACRYPWSGLTVDLCPECGATSTASERLERRRVPITRSFVLPLFMFLVLGGLAAHVWLIADTIRFRSESAAYYRGGGTGTFMRKRWWPAEDSSFVREAPDGPIFNTG